MTRLVFVSTASTGRHPRLHELVELALIERTPPGHERYTQWRLRPARMHEADPEHLARTRYLDRPPLEHDVVGVDPTLGTAAPVSPYALAADLQQRLFGAVLVSLDPARDVAFLAAHLERHACLPGWAGVIDLTSAAAGALHGLLQGWYSAARAIGRPVEPPAVDGTVAESLPWSPYTVARALGVQHIVDDASDAAARARLAATVWDLLRAAPPPPVELPADERPTREAAAVHAPPPPDDRLVVPPPPRPDQTAVMDRSEIDAFDS